MSGSPSWILSAVWISCLLGAAACRRGRGHGGHHSPVIFNEFCAMKDESGPCKAIKERFFFNVNSGSCERFEYGGCGGNANNFETMEECEEACVFSDDKNPCHLPEAPGPCRGLVKRFFFDSQTQQCRHFYYGGCFGNANNFRSMADCQQRCLSPDEPTAVTDAHVRKTALTGPNAAAEEPAVSEPQVQLNASDSQRDFSASEICFSPIDRGSCSGASKRFAFNPETRRCQSFSYSGCGGNQNNFLLRKHCYHKCIRGQKGKDSRHTETKHGAAAAPHPHGSVSGDRKGMIRIRKKNIDSIVNRGD